MKVTIDARGERILEFITDFTAAHGYSPSIREIGDAVALTSTSSVHHQLKKLEKAGALVRTKNRARATVLRPELAAA